MGGRHRPDSRGGRRSDSPRGRCPRNESPIASDGASAPLRLGVPDAATFRALPWPSVSIEGARLDGADGAVRITAPEATLDLSVGATRPGAVRAGPGSSGQPDRDARSRPGAVRGPGSRAGGGGSGGRSGAARRARPDRRRAARHEPQARTRHDDREHSGPARRALAVRGRLQFNLSAVWRGTPFAVSGLLANRERATRGGPSAFELALASPVAALSFKGAFVGGATPGVAGDVTVSIPSLRGLCPSDRPQSARLVCRRRCRPCRHAQGLAQGSRSRRGHRDQRRSDVRGRSSFRRRGRRPSLRSRARSTPIDSRSPRSSVRPGSLLDAGGDWSDRAFSLAPPQDFDLDLRLSAARLDVYGRRARRRRRVADPERRRSDREPP